MPSSDPPTAFVAPAPRRLVEAQATPGRRRTAGEAVRAGPPADGVPAKG